MQIYLVEILLFWMAQHFLTEESIEAKYYTLSTLVSPMQYPILQ